MKFDFLFSDTAHVTPGELINFIEVLPFLKEKAIVVIHDILWQFGNLIIFSLCITLKNIFFFFKYKGLKKHL